MCGCYTISLNIIAVDCAFDILQDDQVEQVCAVRPWHTSDADDRADDQLSVDIIFLSTYLTDLLSAHFDGIPANILALTYSQCL